METAKAIRTEIATGGGSLGRLIAAQSFAAGLDDDALGRLVDTSVGYRLTEDQFLFNQDTPASRFFVVVEGTLKLYRVSPAGDEKIIGRAEAGDSFAEGVVFMDSPHYPVHAQAIEASRVLGLSRDIYRAQLMTSPETCLAVMGQLTGRITRLLDEIESVTLSRGRDRVIRFLLGLLPGSETSENTTTIRLPARKNTIAAQLSIRPETLSRILAALVRDGLIQRTADPGSLHIPDPEILRRAFNHPIVNHGP